MSIAGSLKSLMGTHSKSGAGASASAPKLPAMDTKTTASYTKLKNELEGIQKSMRSIATSTGATAELGNLAKKARAIQPLYKAIQDVKDAEETYITLMKSSTATIHQQVTAYNKLAAAKKKQVQVGNEMGGMMGRMKNVMGSLGKANILMAIGMGILNDAKRIAEGAGEGFDVMARSGQALNKNFEELGASTAKYMFNLNKAALTGAAWGHTAEDSKKSFQLLVQTMGGTDEAVDRVTENFGEFAKIAKYSGMALGDAAAYADQNWKRLGKTIEDSKGDIAEMGLNTANLNSLFGAGSVDSKEYAQTVSDLSFQSGNYNQNTKFLIESLNREVAVQLSLGKSRAAAMQTAKANLEKAGKVNLAGVIMLADKLNAEFKGREASLEEMNKRFGSEGEMMFELMKGGGISQDEMLTLEALAKDSSEMQGKILGEFRRDAAAGGTKGLQTGVMTVGEQNLMQLQEQRRDVEFGKVREATTPEDTKTALMNIFKDVEGASKLDIDAFGQRLQDDPDADPRELFDELIMAIKPKSGKDPVDEFLEQVKGEAVVRGIAALTTLPKAVLSLPASIAIAIAAQAAAETSLGGKVVDGLAALGAAMMPGPKRATKSVQERQAEVGKEFDLLKKQKDPRVRGRSRGEWIRETDASRAPEREEAARKEMHEQFGPQATLPGLPLGDVGGETTAMQEARNKGQDPEAARKKYWTTHSGGVEDFTTPTTPQATKPASEKEDPEEMVFDHQTGQMEPLYATASRQSGDVTLIEVHGMDRNRSQADLDATALDPGGVA